MFKLTLAALCVALVHADVYMHNPRGSNDRNCERNVNRNNANRLFDSQNNAAGGYACPRAVGGPEVETEKMYYYVGSKLPIEWTNQHACGTSPKVKCEVVIQYACEETLDPTQKFRGGNTPTPYFLERPDTKYIGAPRDGTPVDSLDAATFTIPDSFSAAKADTIASRRYGMQETYDYYKKCKETKRNTGLFNADQFLRRNDLRATRQNPDGNRHGFECPSERDHYPFWHPSPWVDIAVLHNHAASESDPAFDEWCDYYRANSQNNANTPAGECVENPSSEPSTAASLKARGLWYNNEAECVAAGHWWQQNRFGIAGGDLPWSNGSAILPVDCRLLPSSRINHLGNADDSAYQKEGLSATERALDEASFPHSNNANRYIWTVPNTPSRNCVIRIRYNITGLEAGGWADGAGVTPGVAAGTPGLNASFNGIDNSPILQDPYIDIDDPPSGDGEDRSFLSLAVNTNQYGRTFQDRSYVFSIRGTGDANKGSEDSQRMLDQDEEVKDLMDGGARLTNLNVRGKRGNIVQTFPSVEYDFVPNDLRVRSGDLVHIQWTGSDYNPRRGCNDGEGGPPDPYGNAAADQNSRADRSNLVEIDMLSANYPLDASPIRKLDGLSMFVKPNGDLDTETIMNLAFLDQETILADRRERCLTREELDAIRNRAVRETVINNCAKINAPRTPYADFPVVTLRKSGTYRYYSSRNANFSNRRQNGRICVSASTTAPDMETYCDSGEQVVPNDEPVPLPPNFQVAGDKIDQDQPLLKEETLAPAPFEINDAEGDGDLYDCEGARFEIPRLDLGDVIILSVIMIAVGVGLTLMVQYAVAYLTTGVSPYDFFCRPARGADKKKTSTADGSSSSASPLTGEKDTLEVTEEGGVGAGGESSPAPTGPPPPVPARKPVVSWAPVHPPKPGVAGGESGSASEGGGGGGGAMLSAAAPEAQPAGPPPPVPSSKPSL